MNNEHFRKLMLANSAKPPPKKDDSPRQATGPSRVSPPTSQQETEVAGGDVKSTHLVKGLDFKLLERVRRGEDVYSDNKNAEQENNDDDEFDQLESQPVKAIARENAEKKKKGQLSTVVTGQKRTRDQILAEFKAARAAAKAAQEEAVKEPAALGDRFRKIGAQQKPGTRMERDAKGREVLIIVDADGHEKRKVRKTQVADAKQGTGLLMPDKEAKPLGMEVPEQFRSKAAEEGKKEEEEDEDVDIFDGVGDDYDPLAGLDDSSDDDDDDDEGKEKEKKEKKDDRNTKVSSSMPPPPRPGINYFKGSKTSLLSEQDTRAPSMPDPAMVAAIKRAAALQQKREKNGLVEDDDDEDDEAAKKARAAEERRRKMLQNVDRDAEDMDLGFGTSRYEDEEDLDDEDRRLSKWGEDGGGGGEEGRGGKKRKRGKKRKGDVNKAEDVLRVMEQRRRES